jgi:short-subunit dehydrogenase
VGKVTMPWITVYSASKYALNSLTDGLRMELAEKGIRFVAVCPGHVKTAFGAHALVGRPPAALERARAFSITAEGCAEAILRAVERGTRTVVVPAAGWILVGLARLLPWLIDWQLARIYRSVE